MADRCYIEFIESPEKIECVSPVTSDGRESMLECFSFEDGVTNPCNPSKGTSTGQRAYQPVKVRTAIGVHTVHLAKACALNHTIKMAIHMYRPSQKGDVASHRFMTLTLNGAMITGITRVIPDSEILGTDEARVPYEIIEFVYKDCTWSFMPEDASEGSSAEHLDEWANR